MKYLVIFLVFSLTSKVAWTQSSRWVSGSLENSIEIEVRGEVSIKKIYFAKGIFAYLISGRTKNRAVAIALSFNEETAYTLLAKSEDETALLSGVYFNEELSGLYIESISLQRIEEERESIERLSHPRERIEDIRSEVRTVIQKIRKIRKVYLILEYSIISLEDIGSYKQPPQEILENSDSQEPSSGAGERVEYSYNPNLFNVTKERPLGDYTPLDLVPIAKMVDTRTRRILLRKDAALQLKKMFKGANRESIPIAVTSGYRNKRIQRTLYKKWIAKNPNEVFPAVARPGHSEHQMGTAVDITSYFIGYQSATDLFAETQAFKWLEKNADRYGFVLSYPEGKESTTGYKFEPWHWRYVGQEKAKMIKESGETIIEFLGHHK